MTAKLEELLLAARRGELSKSEAQQLEHAFDEAPDERIWHRAGLRFDAEEAASHDAEEAEHLVSRVLAGRPSPMVQALPRARRVRPVVLLVAAAVLIASAAAAVAGIVRLRQAPPSELPPAPSAAPPVDAAPKPRTTVTEPALPAPSAEAPPVAPPEPAAREVTEPTPQTAAELSSAAGRARRKGDTARAITLLEALQSRFPGSPEAREGDISLGMLRLQRGASSAALRDFERYLGRNPGGARTADALWGRAKALIALGRRNEAEASLQQLVSRYPQSPFTSAAQAELRSAKPSTP